MGPNYLIIVLIIGALAASESAVSRAKEEINAIDRASTESVAWVTDQVATPSWSGPGFRRFVRGMIGGYYEEDQAGFDTEPATTSVSNSGGVHAIFETPNDDFLLGYRDYGLDVDIDVDDSDSLTFGVTAGPGSDVGSDREADNIDADATGGPFILLGPDGHELTFGYDFDDLHLFNIRFSELTISHERWLGSAELMAQHLWSREKGILNKTPTWRFTLLGVGPVIDLGNLPVADIEATRRDTKPRSGWLRGFRTVNYFAYGLRYNQSRDEISWLSYVDGVSGWERLSANIRTQNSLIGPQLAVGRVASKGRWMFDLSGTILLAYQETETTVRSSFGENIITGGLNNSATADPTYYTEQRRERHFAQHAEVRFTTSYLIRRHWSLDAMLRGFLAAPWYESQDRFVFALPSFKLQSSDAQALVGANLFLGVTYLR